jgi:protein-L-isoaspartate(D-aspartate) O-methyltransferase
MTQPEHDQATDEEARWQRQRRALIEDIALEIRETEPWTGRAALGSRVRAALEAVPRHEFVPPSEVNFAYINRPLPIGHGQTISQPYVVAIMTELLDTEPDHTVLEVGTGSGYQAAVLAALVRQVYSIEAVPGLAVVAAERLARLGYANVEVQAGDGGLGWPEHAPFDRIMVTAAAPKIPPPLIAQLKPDGRMIIPVGKWSMNQNLMVVIKSAEGGVETRERLPVAFVPLVGRHAKKRGWW